MKIAWVTDSTCYIDDSIRTSIGDLFVVPLNILIGNEEFQEGINLNTEQLFEKIKETSNVSTSQPAIGVFQELYQKLAQNYDHIISIHLSAELSGTYSSALQASKLVDDVEITVIDSKVLTYPLTELLLLGKAHADNGLSSVEIEERLLKTIETSEVYVMVGSLEQLHRSGRMNGVSFFLGSVLNIKPVLSLENGSLVVKEKVRSIKKGLSRMLDYLEDSLSKHKIEDVCVLYGRDAEEAENRKRKLEERFPNIRFQTYPIGAIIGVHAGENTMALTWYREKY